MSDYNEITAVITTDEPEIAATLDELRYIVFKGKQGDTGDSAYEEAVKLGFEGTEEEWIASLKGEQGEPGKAKSAYLDYDVVRLIEDDSVYTSLLMRTDIDNGVLPFVSRYIESDSTEEYFELDYQQGYGANPVVYFRSKEHLLSVDSTGHFTLTDRAQGGGSADAVLYTPQTPTPAQQEQARENIGVEYMTASDADDMWVDADGDIPGTETYGSVEKIKAKMVLKESNNLSKSDSDWKDGYRVRNGAGDEVAAAGLSCSKMIPVETGNVIRLYDLYGGTFGGREMRTVATYADDGTAIPNPDATGWKVRSYTVADGVKYVRISAPTASNYMVTKDYIPVAFEPWFEPYFVATDEFVRDAVGNVKTVDLSNQIAFALPQLAFRQTVGLAQKWYKRSMMTPASDLVYVRAGYNDMTDSEDGVTFNNAVAKSNANGYIWFGYDQYFNLLKKYDAGTGYGASVKVIAENLQNCTVLAIGDSTVDSDNLTGTLMEHFDQQGKTVTLLGTLGAQTDPLNRNEGRAGWSTADYMTDSTTSGYSNPFYNLSVGSFDFGYYMQQQGYSEVDFVVIQLGINDLYPKNPRTTEEPDYAAIWGNIKEMIDSILSYSSDVAVLVNLPTTPNADPSKHLICEWLYRHFVIRYNEYALAKIKEVYSWSRVRATYCHLILDPATDIRDNVHPTAAGYEKMALEIVNQINCWQNET